jgi:RNA polymerase subunit RPABC4/transcription elongation factor Spt4
LTTVESPVSPRGRRRYRHVVSDDPRTTDQGADEERVRVCLQCGELVAYSERACPSCGHVEPLPGGPVEPAHQPCRACSEPKDERLLFCPACGAEAAPAPWPRTAPWTTPPAGGVESASVVLALVAPLLLLIALLQVVLGAAGTLSGR